MAATWLEEIVSAFETLGGVVSYDQLYRYIEANTSRQLTKAWKATVRREVENHSTDSENYRVVKIFFTPSTRNSLSLRYVGIEKLMRSPASQQVTGQTIDDYTTIVDNTDKKSISENIADYVPQAELLDIDDIDDILDKEEEELVAVQDFNPEDIIDARERIFAAIVRRRGQSKFRLSLLQAYDGKCPFSTGTSAQHVLEASHILAYKGSSTNSVSNGLLLRADIHTLFDLRLLAIDTTNLTVLVSSQLQDTEYANLAGKIINLPTIASEPSEQACPRYPASRGPSLDL